MMVYFSLLVRKVYFSLLVMKIFSGFCEDLVDVLPVFVEGFGMQTLNLNPTL